jgi:hypothetical protein
VLGCDRGDDGTPVEVESELLNGVGDCEGVGGCVGGDVNGVVGGGGGGGGGISKISTTSEYPLEFIPPPKKILFVDDVDASQ